MMTVVGKKQREADCEDDADYEEDADCEEEEEEEEEGRKEGSKLVFYAQSTNAVISWR